MDPVVVLDAAMSLAAARSALTLAPPGEMVVVRRRDPRATGAILSGTRSAMTIVRG